MQNETSCWDWVSAFLCRAQATLLVKLMVVVVGRTLVSPLMWVPLWMCSEPEGSPLCACTHVSLCPVRWGILSCTLHCSLGPDRYVAWQVALYGSHRSCIYMTWSGDWGAELMLGRAARWGPLLHPVLVQSGACSLLLLNYNCSSLWWGRNLASKQEVFAKDWRLMRRYQSSGVSILSTLWLEAWELSVRSEFTVLCQDTFLAVLRPVQPAHHGSDMAGRFSVRWNVRWIPWQAGI